MSVLSLIDTVVAVVLFVNVTEAAMADKPARWTMVLGVSSASLGERGAILVTSSAVSWPDGTQDLVTFWETDEAIYRCVDHMISNAPFTAGPCFIPR